MVNHHRFTQYEVKLRADYTALRVDNVHPYRFWDKDRVLAFHRWLESTVRDVIVVRRRCPIALGGAMRSGSRAGDTGRRSSTAMCTTTG